MKVDSDQIYKKIGSNVAKLRKARGLSQLDLAYCMGYSSVGFISAAEICSSSKHFNIEHLVKISTILECSLFELLEDVGTFEYITIKKNRL